MGGIGKTALAGRVITRPRGDGWAVAVHDGRCNPKAVAVRGSPTRWMDGARTRKHPRHPTMPKHIHTANGIGASDHARDHARHLRAGGVPGSPGNGQLLCGQRLQTHPRLRPCLWDESMRRQDQVDAVARAEVSSVSPCERSATARPVWRCASSLGSATRSSMARPSKISLGCSGCTGSLGEERVAAAAPPVVARPSSSATSDGERARRGRPDQPDGRSAG